MDAFDAVANFATLNPKAQRLAELACLAVRVEPHFLRTLRQRFLHDSHPSVELDLWHGPLVASAGADAFTFDVDVLRALRYKLAAEPEHLKSEVLKLTLHCHAHQPALARLEMELNALAVVRHVVADGEIEALLSDALDVLQAGGEPARVAARWLLHAAPRLHPRVLEAGATWFALMHASAMLGGRRLIAQEPPAGIDIARLARMHPLPQTSLRAVGVSLVSGLLQFRSPLLAGAKIMVPAVSPSVVAVTNPDGNVWSVEAEVGVTLNVMGASVVTVDTPTGDRFRLVASRHLSPGAVSIVGRFAPLRMRAWARTARTIAFAVSERDATDASEPDRNDVRAEVGIASQLREIINSVSNDSRHDVQIRSTLHHLLIPGEIVYMMGGTSETTLTLDSFTATIPWELLDMARVEFGSMGRPWAIRSKLLRAVDTKASRFDAPSPDDAAIVIGEPLSDSTTFAPMPGARVEALSVIAQLRAGPGALATAFVHALVSGADDASTVIRALTERPYRILHVAGHGIPGATGGVVLSGRDTILGAEVIGAMRIVPELVFMNCCHVADPSLVVHYDRTAFAANMAESLMQIGVRCVICAGLAVEVEPAVQFAGTFYEALLAGERFVDAVALAREAAWRHTPEGNTWAAYQCYGDPEWRWRRDAGDDATDNSPSAEMPSPEALTQALEVVATQACSSVADGPRLQRRVRAFEQRYGQVWGELGAVAQAFGAAFGMVNDDDRAVLWYRSAMRASDSAVNFKTVERLAYHLMRRSEGEYDISSRLHDMAEAIDQLHRLVAIQRSAARENLLGRAFMSQARLEASARHSAASIKSLRQSIDHFAASESLAEATRPALFFDSGKNRLVAELRLAWVQDQRPKLDGARIDGLHHALARVPVDAEFSPLAAQLELRWLEALADGALASMGVEIESSLKGIAVKSEPSDRTLARLLAAARFTLEPYQNVASAVEANAARQLIALLEALPKATGRKGTQFA